MSNKKSTLEYLDKEFLWSIFRILPDAAVLANPKREIIAVNQAFTDIFGYTLDEARGKTTQFIYASEEDFLDTHKVFKPEPSKKVSHYEKDYRRKSGEVFTGETVGKIVTSSKDEVLGYLGLIYDKTIFKKQEDSLTHLNDRLELLVKILHQESFDLQKQIQQTLQLTNNLLGTEVGIVSQIIDDSYYVRHYYPEDSELETDMRFDFRNTYCHITVEKDDVLDISNMGESEHAHHPCYEFFKLESYIGIPIYVKGELYGTLNFSSTQPNDGFSTADRDIIQLISDWLGVILEREKIEEELRESREHFQLVAENTSDMIALHKPDGTYEYVSPSVNKILGYAPEELLGTSPYELFHPDDLERIQSESHQKALEKNPTKSFEYRIRDKQGSYLWFDTSTEIITNDEGEIVHLQTTSRNITPRKNIELLHKKSRTLALVGGWEWDLTENMMQVTDEVRSIFGMPPGSDIHYENGITFFSKDSKKKIEEAFRKAMLENESFDLKANLKTSEGTYKTVRIIGEALWENGEAKKLVGALQDVTRQETTAELFDDSQIMANVGGWEYTLESGELFWTDEVYRIHELPIGKDLKVEEGLSFFPGEAKEKIQRCIEKTIETRKPYDLTLPFVTAKGNERMVRAIGKAVVEDDKVYKLRGTFQDVTEQKRLERLLNSAQGMANVGGWEFDVQSGDLFWSDEVYHIHEIPVGTPVKVADGISYYHGKARETITKAINRSIETKEGWDLELPFVSAKGNHKWVRAIGSVKTNAKGEVTKMVGVFQDLTDRKEMENKLVQAKEEAELANQAKSQFVANISHEIRTPMNSILGFTELLEKTASTPKEKQYLENIASSGKLLLKLINDILDLSKIEAGAEEIQLVPTNVSRVVKEVVDTFSVKADQKGLGLELEVDDTIPESLLMDDGHVQQILFNLIGNAVKFTEEGSVKINVTADMEEIDASSVDLSIAITDTGIGIKEEKLDRIFNAFEQEGREISNRFGGTGLGLSISKNLAEKMDGEITVKSTLGEGSTFTLAINNVVVSSVVPVYEADIHSAKDIKLNPGRILIADDIKVNRDLVAEYLTDQPLEIIEAESGSEAVALCSQYEFDLILMDIKMPGMNGLEALKLIKQENKEAVVVALTASGFNTYKEIAREQGFNGFLRKPVTQRELLLEIGGFLGYSAESSGQLSVGETQKEKEDNIPLGEEKLTSRQTEQLQKVWEEKIHLPFNQLNRNAILIDECEAFAESILSIGDELNITSLSLFAAELLGAAQVFDTKHIQHLLETFERFDEKLSKELS
ncbi:PAS domain S-box protein [Gracilimonas mengyeensis]|uniref:histidine kinase n=1 Tax=Gracilimonas mengyeensis TaxID=1302730 RepID=A0A521B0S3_9BACT|nr:PAS domain S-box protein [Gracilimonas mengyeensis]SMO40704.1 PAS domain S-box-containing protein [Gracilimonas mengyeensis]